MNHCRCTHWGSSGGIIGGEGCPDREIEEAD
jgi:hypothetical protein